MKLDANNLGRAEKILVFLYEFGNGSRVKVRYEDIVVGLFKKYPQTFHLKGYEEYPDSGDLVHKPLYEYKKKGFVNASNKIFSLTERGAELAAKLVGRSDNWKSSESRLSRPAETEISRVKNLEGYLLFSGGDEKKLSDRDFYDYLGVTVRTQKNAFIGRLNTMKAVVEELGMHPKDVLSKTVIDYHVFLIAKYTGIIEFFTKG